MVREVSYVVVFVSLMFSGASRSFAEESSRPSIVVGRVMKADGTFSGSMRIAFDGPNIKSIQPALLDVEWPGADQYDSGVAVPGLFDVYSEVGAMGSRDENSYAVDAAANAVDAIDIYHRQIQQALAHGVTSMLIAPASVNIVAGAAAVVRASGRHGIEVLRDDGPLVFAFGAGVYQRDREPTSRMGAAAMLRRITADANDGRGHQRLQAFVKGTMNALAVCQSPQDVTVAANALRDNLGHVTFVHTSDVHDLSFEMEAARAVVVGPLTFDMSSRTLSAAGEWSKAGLKVALAGQSPRYSFDSLRISAALAVQYGMSPAKARQAITSVPAEIAGVADKVGSLTPGRFGDVVIFSDDPLRLDAKILAVYVGGRRVHPGQARLAKMMKETR